jgi:SAM-dependent methyltransferase
MTDYSEYARQYARQYSDGEFEPVIARIRRARVLAAMRAYPHGRVLEVGCGFEPLFPDLDDCGEYWTVEPGEEAVRAARAHPAASDRVHVVEGFLENAHGQLPAGFDFIVVSSLLHEVADPAGLCAAVRALCSPATIVHFNVPNVRSFHRLLALEMGLIADLFEESETEKRFQRRTRFDLGSLTAFMRDSGFDVVASGTYFVKPFTHAQMEQMLRQGIIDMRVVAALDGMTRHLPELGCEMFVDVRLRP